MEKCEQPIEERVRMISESMTDTMGYVFSGGIRWGNRAIKLVEEHGGIKFHKVFEYIRCEHMRNKMLSIIEEKGDALIYTFTQSKMATADMIVNLELDPEGAAFIDEQLREDLNLEKLKETVAKHRFTYRTCIYGKPVDMELVRYARAYNETKYPTKYNGVMSPGLLKSVCDRVQEIERSNLNDNDKKNAHKQIAIFLRDKHGKNITHNSLHAMLKNECAKSILEHGIVVHEEYQDWARKAIAVASLWRMNHTSVRKDLDTVTDNLFTLSHFNEIPNAIVMELLDETEEALENIKEAEIPVGLSVKWNFIGREHHNDDYFFNIMARMSENCGRKTVKDKRKIKTNVVT